MASTPPTFDARQFLLLSLPLSLQFFLRNCVTMTDNFMVGYLGNEYLAALKIGSDYVRFLIVVVMAVTTAGTVLASRYWGAGDRVAFRRVVSLVLGLCLAISAGMAGMLLTGGPLLSRAMIDDPAVSSLSGAYLRIYGPAMIFTCVNMALAIGFVAQGKTRQPFVQQAVTTLANVVLNYLLIFGNFGFPRMEVRGAAWASVIAEGLGCGVLGVIALRAGHFAGVRCPIAVVRRELREISALGWPLLCNMALWQGSMLVYLKVIATLGAGATATWGVSSLFTGILFIFVVGFRISTSVRTGQLLGAGEDNAAYAYAKRAVRFTLLTVLAPITVVVALSPAIPSWFQFSSEGYMVTVVCLILTGVKQIVNTASSMYSHILIAGKDSRTVLIVTLVALLLVGIPFSVLVGIVWQMGMVAIFLVLMSEDALKAALYYRRFRSRRWMLGRSGAGVPTDCLKTTEN